YNTMREGTITACLIIIITLCSYLLYNIIEINNNIKKLSNINNINLLNSVLLSKVSVHPSALKYLLDARIIFIDGAEGSISWSKYGWGDVTTDKEIVFNDKHSLKLRTVNRSWTIIEALRLFSPPKSKKVGFCFWWAALSENLGYIVFGIEYRNANNNYRKAGEIYIYEHHRPYYKLENGTIVKFSSKTGLPERYDTSQRGGDICWHFVLIIVDFEKDEYVSLIIDDVEVDMRGIKIYDRSTREGMAQSNMMEVFVILSSGTKNASTTAFIDDVIVFSIE
ncbi:MAG: hypothetical protein DRJ41_02450, partial [Thermoprotei archaeon]